MSSSDFFSSVAAKVEPLVSSFTKLGEGFSQPMRDKLLLVFNHVVAQEPQAMERLRVYTGRTIMFETPLGHWPLCITPAGLFEATPSVVEGDEVKPADLRLKMRAPDPAELGNMLFKAQRPPVVIEGDADLAAAFAWLVDNLRWDYAEDLSRIIGDTPTQFALDQLKAMVGFFRGFLDAVSQRAGRFRK